METVEIRPRNSLPITIQLRPSERLDQLAQQGAEHERAVRDLEKQIRSLEVEAQRLDQNQTFSLEASQKRAGIKRQLAAAEQQLLEHRARRDQVLNQREQWVEQIGNREYMRRRLWQELSEARPGPVSDWSMTRMYAIGQREQRTTGDVKRDLIDTLTWLLNFGGPDDELQRELTQLSQEEADQQ